MIFVYQQWSHIIGNNAVPKNKYYHLLNFYGYNNTRQVFHYIRKF